MSPLVDVTNSGSQNSVVDRVSKKCSKKETGKPQKKKTELVDGVSRSDVSLKEGPCWKPSECSLESIKMCNTCVKSHANYEGSRQGGNQDHCMLDSMRVPPIPQTNDEVLSQAVHALSLSSLSLDEKPSARHNRHRKQNHRRLGRNISGHPENPKKSNGTDAIRTPQQCGACGLEFTSLPILTQHLAKHVYDGLYAAQWLTQAMSLVNRQPASEALLTTVHSVPHEDDENGGVRSQNKQHLSSSSD